MPKTFTQREGESDSDFAARKSMANPRPPTRSEDEAEMDRYVEYLRDAMEEASGWKRDELKQKLADAEKDRDARKEVANIAAEASKYGADKSYQASIYGSDKSLAGTQYSSDRQYDSTKYTADAGERNSQRTADSSHYTADAGLAGTKYSSDTDRYKTDVDQGNKRAEQALKFLDSYTQLSQRPDDYLQASNYARLGRQVEGMPVMVQELLGQINPSAQSRGGSTANMPLNAAVGTFGTDPLHLVGERSAAPPAPVMQYPQQSGTQVTAQSYPTSYGAGYGAPPIPGQSSGYGAPPIPGQPSYLGVPEQGAAATQYPQYPQYPVQNIGDAYAMKYQQVQDPNAEQVYSAMGSPDIYYGDNAYNPYVGAEAAPRQVDSQGVPRPGAWSQQLIAESTPTPRGVTANFGPDNQAGQDALRLAGRKLLARGAHALGNQQKERMSGTDIGLTNSALKDAGGVPDDYWLTYDRTRIGNDGSMAAA